MSKLEYKIPIPAFYWWVSGSNPKLFKQYVLGYMKLYHPDLKIVRIKKPYYLVCVKR